VIGDDETHDDAGWSRARASSGAARGCGALSADDLELLALRRADPEVPVDAAAEAHVAGCPVCEAAVSGHDVTHSILREVAALGPPKPRAARATGAPGEDAGPIPGYRLLGELHRGGQGVVHRAEQVATKRRCAVKMLLGGRFAGDRQLERFEREVEVVARMRHPSIVTLYESGRSRDGEPFFAMELVEGERLDEFVRRAAPGARGIARLFREIAGAVAYAHRRGVIHRDLKPGNVLVDEDGTPRVLDFGLAREEAGPDDDARPSATMAGEFLGTFGYAAPEQLAGDPAQIDSRCDLYALGTMLFECLVGRKPFEGARSIADLVAQKTLASPPRPGAHASGVPRDLDVIAMRLLAPDPARRYDTADALVEDLSRFLDGRPILAREDSVLYVVGKTLRRHWLLTGAGAALLATIVGSGVALAVAYAEADRARVRAERTLSSFRDAVGSVNPEAGSGSAGLSLEEFLALIEENSAAALAKEPAVLAGVLDTIGIVHLGFEDVPRAESSLARALGLRRELAARGECGEAELAESLHNMGRAHYLAERFSEAAEVYREAIALRRRALGESDARTLLSERHLASCLRRLGALAEARATYDSIEARARETPGFPALELAAIINARAALDSAEGDLDSALAGFERALEAIRSELAPDDYRIGRSHLSIALVAERLGRIGLARTNAERAVEILRARKGGESMTVQRAEALLARLDATPPAP
jgi:tetratricopeptide (TPR) repeat protein